MKRILCALLTLPAITHAADIVLQNFPLHGKTFMLTRSQSVNAARDLVGWRWNYPVICSGKTLWSSFSVTPEYIQSFRPDAISEYFFGNPCLNISGSLVPNRGRHDILADNFGLSQTFISSVKLRPELKNALADVRLELGYGCFYFHAHAPVVWARTQIRIDECVENNGLEQPFVPLYMDQGAVEPVIASFTQAVTEGAVYGQVTEPLLFGRFGCPATTTKLSEIQLALGYVIAERPHGWMSGNIRASIPTGTRPDSRILFEPIVGNGHHWEFGIGFLGQGVLWQKDADKIISVWLEANLTHLFTDTQCRSFDLCPLNSSPCDPNQFSGFGSRYILTKEFDEQGNYANVSFPTINRTTLQADVSINVQLDVALMFAFEYCNWAWDVGYNAWIRSRENINLDTCLPFNRLALKGIANVANGLGGPSMDTQSKATLHGDEFANQALVIDANPPVFYNTAQIDIDSAATSRMLSHKIFAHSNYSWYRMQPCALQPFIGIGFEVEFQGNRPQDLQPNKGAVSQWGVWIKGGVGY